MAVTLFRCGSVRKNSCWSCTGCTRRRTRRMSGNMLQKYTGARQADPSVASSIEAEHLDDLGAFGFLRGVRDRSIMLELQHKDGRVSAYGYAWLDHVEFNPSA